MITTRKRTNIYLFAVLLLFTTIGGVAATASDVDPVYLPDNPSCSDVGYDYGFKVDPPNSGTYAFPLTTYGVTISTADGVYLDWTSELGVDAVTSEQSEENQRAAQAGAGHRARYRHAPAGSVVRHAPRRPKAR